MSFNPDDFFNSITVKDIVAKFPHLSESDYSITDLNDELIKLNYELTSKEYRDISSSSIEDYYKLEVDEIV